MNTDKAKYLNLFKSTHNFQTISKVEAALEVAIATRNFEIELYWKRTGYFWTFIAAITAGTVAVLNAKDIADRELISTALTFVSMLSSYIWVLVNIGSKFWQSNWEEHISYLEDEKIGPLFKTQFRKPGQLVFSVSKLNLILASMFFSMNVLLFEYTLGKLLSVTGFGGIVLIFQGLSLIFLICLFAVITILSASNIRENTTKRSWTTSK